MNELIEIINEDEDDLFDDTNEYYFISKAIPDLKPHFSNKKNSSDYKYNFNNSNKNIDKNSKSNYSKRFYDNKFSKRKRDEVIKISSLIANRLYF